MTFVTVMFVFIFFSKQIFQIPDVDSSLDVQQVQVHDLSVAHMFLTNIFLMFIKIYSTTKYSPGDNADRDSKDKCVN